jgi:hypothetical protein
MRELRWLSELEENFSRLFHRKIIHFKEKWNQGKKLGKHIIKQVPVSLLAMQLGLGMNERASR